MSEQIAVRLPNALAASLDELVASGQFPTRADAVRSAIVTLIDHERRLRIGQEIADGYRRLPQSEEEVAAATSAAIASIHDEPW